MNRLLTFFALGIFWAALGIFGAEPVPENRKVTQLGTLAGKLDNSLIPAVEALHDGRATSVSLTRDVQRGLATSIAPTPTGKLPVTLDIPKVDAVMLKNIQDTGANVLNSSEKWNSVTVLASVTEIDTLVRMQGVRRVSLARRAIRRKQGVADNQADAVMKTDVTRVQSGLTGNGVKVGVVALSCNQSATFKSMGVVTGVNLTNLPDQVSGDLPASIQLIDPGPDAGFQLPDGSFFDPGADYDDEGAAMMELIHDIAPSAALAFASAEYDQTTMAANITKLQQANCRITVDDVGYPDEPFFQDGPIAQSIRTGYNNGVTHFTAVGNDGDAGVMGVYTPVNASAPVDPSFVFPTGNYFHNFNIPGQKPGFLPIDVPDGSGLNIILQWNQPFSRFGLGTGATLDLDLFLYKSNADTTVYDASSADPQGVPGAPMGDPLEVIDPVKYRNNTGSVERVYLAINSPNGNAANVVFRVIIQSDAQLTFPFGGAGQMTAFGHTAMNESIAVGAVFYADALSGGKFAAPGEDANAVNAEPYSSKGGIGNAGVPYYFDTTGAPLAGAPQRRDVPSIAAPDGGNTTFYGDFFNATINGVTYGNSSQPSFFGTSAAAPNAAGVAALLLERASLSSPAQIKYTLQSTAVDIVASAPASGVGNDDLTGFGLINGLAALNSVPNILTNPQDQTILAGDTVSFSITASGNVTLTYQWQKDGANITGETGIITGTNPAVLTLTNVPNSANNTRYRCVVTNAQGTAVSSAALLTVRLAPEIKVQPQDQIVTLDFPATFTVQAINGPLTYRWQRNGQDIPLATNPSYTVPAVALVDNNATYQCFVTNTVTTVPSRLATLTVNTLPAILSGPTATPGAATVGQMIQFSVSALGARGQAVTYNWDFGDGNSANTANASHAYGAAQNYTVTLTVTDTVNASTIRTLVVIVFLDGDGNGQPDLNPNGDNTAYVDAYKGLNNLNSQTLDVKKMSVGLNFKKRGSDSMSISGTLIIPAGFTAANKVVTTVVGGVGRVFMLSSKGKGSAVPNGSFQLSFKSKVTGPQFAKYALKVSKADIQDILATSGLLNKNAKNEGHTIRTTIFFNSAMFDKLQPQIYTAKQGTSGKTK